MKKHTFCSLLTLASLIFTGCVGTPTIPFQDVLTTAPLFRTLDKLKIEEEFDEVGTSSLSQEAQQELKAVAKSSANEKRVLLEIQKPVHPDPETFDRYRPRHILPLDLEHAV